MKGKTKKFTMLDARMKWAGQECSHSVAEDGVQKAEGDAALADGQYRFAPAHVQPTWACSRGSVGPAYA